MTALPVLGACLTAPTLERLRDWAFDAARDLELQDFYWPNVLAGDWTPLTDRYRRLLDGYTGRVGIHGPFWGFAIDTMDPEVLAVVRRRLNQGLDICAAVGGTHMVVHSPFTTWDWHNLDAWPGGREGKIERTVANIAEIAKRAEGMGVALVIENIEDKDPRDRAALAAAFESPAVRLSVDTGHAHYAHGATGAPPVDHYILAAGAKLEHVHIQDTDAFGDRHWAPGDGTIRWASVFNAIALTGARPRVMLELADEAEIERGWAHLKALGLCL